MKKRILTVLLAVCLILALSTITAQADGVGDKASDFDALLTTVKKGLTGDTENYVTLDLKFGSNIAENTINAAEAVYEDKKFVSGTAANVAYMALFGVGWENGSLNIIANDAPLYNFRDNPDSVTEVIFTVHGSVDGFTSITSAYNNIDCTVGGNHQIFHTSITIKGEDDINGKKAEITGGNIQAYVAGGYDSMFQTNGTLTVENLVFNITGDDHITIGASAAHLGETSQVVESASMVIKDCVFNDYLYLYDNFNNQGKMDYTVKNCVFNCEDYGNAIFVQSNYGPATVTLSENQIIAKTWVVDCNVKGAAFTLEGNKITKTEDTRGAAVQLTNGSGFVIENNTIESAGNAFWIHDGKGNNIDEETTITITENTVDAKYLICDSGKDADFKWSNNSVSQRTNVTQGRLNNDGSGKELFQPVSNTTVDNMENTLSNYISISGVNGIENKQYPTLGAAMSAIADAGTTNGEVTLTINGEVDISSQLNDNKLLETFDLSNVSGLTGLTIKGKIGSKLVSGVDGNDIDGNAPNSLATAGTYRCPVVTIKLPEDAQLDVNNLTFPNDLLFDSPGGSVVVQNCVFNGGQSGYPKADSVSYLNNTFDFKGTPNNFYSHNAYPVWYKIEDAFNFVFRGNVVNGYRGVHIETRTDTSNEIVNIAVDGNRFTLNDPDHENKEIALQIVNKINGDVSFLDNYVDGYMGICFFNGVYPTENAGLNVSNNYMMDGGKLYGSSEWNRGTSSDPMADADKFAQEIVEGILGANTDSSVESGHTNHNFVNGVCTICGYREIIIPDTYDIELIVGAGGEAKTSLTNASAGAVITVTATPDEGYSLDYITVDGERISGTTFKMPDHDVTVRVYFTNGSATLPFTDVNSGDWFYDYVAYVYANGLMDGTSATTFAPNANMTRAMVWAILARIDGETVTGANWVDTARDWAMANGVSDGTDPNGNVTREQLATMLWRYAGEPESDYGLSAFTDAGSVSDYAETAMAWAVENGIISGMTETTIAPQGTATRAQCAAMLMRFVENA